MEYEKITEDIRRKGERFAVYDWTHDVWIIGLTSQLTEEDLEHMEEDE